MMNTIRHDQPLYNLFPLITQWYLPFLEEISILLIITSDYNSPSLLKILSLYAMKAKKLCDTCFHIALIINVCVGTILCYWNVYTILLLDNIYHFCSERYRISKLYFYKSSYNTLNRWQWPHWVVICILIQ